MGLATLVGLGMYPTVNVREGAGLGFAIVESMPRGTSGLEVLGARADADGDGRGGKTYQWIQVKLSDTRTGWVRDDLVEIEGDLTSVGYGELTSPMLAFSLTRQESTVSRGAVIAAEAFEPEFPAGTATLRGIDNFPTVNIRAGAGTHYLQVVSLPKGTSNLRVLDARPDEEGRAFQEKTYQWLNITLPDGRTGWVRDDLVEIMGDLSSVGYGKLVNPVVAFSLTRDVTGIVVPPPHMPAAACIAEITGIASLSFVRVRSSASRLSSEVMQANRGLTGLSVLGAEADQQGEGLNGKTYQWFKLQFPNGVTGWVRDDLISIQGDCSNVGYGNVANLSMAFSLTRAGTTTGGTHGVPGTGSGGLFPRPVENTTVTNPFGSGHLGIDFAPGTTIYSGPAAGIVVRAFTCAKCPSQGPSAYNKVPKDQVFNDPGWGWGFGNHVIVCYQNSVLPASTQQALASSGHAGHHLFVMYAHMGSMKVGVGNIAPKTPLGIMGNTGYSTNPHLHVELKAGASTMAVSQNGGWAALGDSLNPGILFTT